MNEIVKFLSSLHPIVQGIIYAIIAAIIITVITFIIKRIQNNSKEKRTLENERLKIHFMELKSEANAIIVACNLSEFLGAILINQTPEMLISVSQYVKDFSKALLPVPLSTFIAHFPKEASSLTEYRKNIEKHNIRRFALDTKIKSDFENRQISVLNVNNTSNESFYVYDSIYITLFKWWQECYQHKANPRPNFDNIESRADQNPNNLYAEGWGAQAIAYANTTSDKQKCKNEIQKVAHNSEYQKEVIYLTVSADVIITAVEILSHQLKEKLDEVERYWPGTKSYKFKKAIKNCPKCKEIFG